MSKSTRSGFLVIADISGYTAYLNDSELEHAHEVLRTLLNLLVEHAKAPLVLSNLEGDAVLSYAIDTERFEAQAFIELIETTYVAFKRSVDLMVINTTCDCNACANIGNLDLKFFVHHGEFVLNALGGREELVGSDVNLIHRMTKNHIVERVGFEAYTFYTSEAMDQLDLAAEDDVVTYDETFDDVGTVRGGVVDMTPIWEELRGRPVLRADERRTTKFVADYPVPRELVWGYLTNPESRAVFSNTVMQVTHDRRRNRVAPGTVYECFHGDGTVTTNTILEWQPFERIVSRNTAGPTSHFIAFYDLEEIEGGTRLTMRWSIPQGMSLSERFVGLIRFPRVRAHQNQGLLDLKEMIDADVLAGRLEVPREVGIDADEVSDAASAALPGL